jgi:hypothetical protein
MTYRSTLFILASIFLVGCASTAPYVWNPDPWPHAGRVPAPGETIRVYTETSLHEIAVHEAAHAVAIAAYYGVPIVTDIHIHVRTPDGSGHDHIGVVESNRPGSTNPSDVQPRIIVSEIGKIAEGMLTSASPGDGTDQEHARDSAWLLYTFPPWRIGRWRYDPETAPQHIKEKVALEIEAADRCSKKMITANRQLILEVAALILRQPTVNGLRTVDHGEFVRFMSGRRIAIPCP